MSSACNMVDGLNFVKKIYISIYIHMIYDIHIMDINIHKYLDSPTTCSSGQNQLYLWIMFNCFALNIL